MEALLIGWRRGDVGGVDREEKREERGGECLGKAVVREDGVVGGVGMASFGLGRPEFGEGGEEEVELDKDVFGLIMEGGVGPDFFVAWSSGTGSITGKDTGHKSDH